MTAKLPPSASVAHSVEGARLFNPAAGRNTAALCDLLLAHAPREGRALEIASGTGQHIVAFATTLPALLWHPTEPSAPRRASIDAYVATEGLTNVAPAATLDATVPGWSGNWPANDLIILCNLLHLIPAPAAAILLHEAALALAPGGTLILYGPFARDGTLTSDGDVKFDAELRGADPTIGYKDASDMLNWLDRSGLGPIKLVEMPANNLAIIARKA